MAATREPGRLGAVLEQAEVDRGRLDSAAVGTFSLATLGVASVVGAGIFVTTFLEHTPLLLLDEPTAHLDVLLTGASGAGKSTILRGIGGQPAPGVHVRLAGADAAGVDPAALAEHVTLVAQDAHVFDGTIRENLRLGAPDAAERDRMDDWSPSAHDQNALSSPTPQHPQPMTQLTNPALSSMTPQPPL
jgi:hypothetical protein